MKRSRNRVGLDGKSGNIHVGHVIFEVVGEHPIRKIFSLPQPHTSSPETKECTLEVLYFLALEEFRFCFQSLIHRTNRAMFPKGD